MEDSFIKLDPEKQDAMGVLNNPNSSLTSPLLADREDSPLKCTHLSSKDTSFSTTVFHGINALSGVGILSVPYALASGGWLSLALIFVIAAAAFYSGLLIIRCMDIDSTVRTYPDIGEIAFGKTGRYLVSVSMYTELYLVAIGFLILEGDNCQNLVPNFGLDIGGLYVNGRQCFVVIVALIILPTVLLDNLSLLSYVSASGVLASAIIWVSILCVAASGRIDFNHKTEIFNPKGIPTSVSLYAFCYCAHPVFPTLYTSMKNKHQFSNALVICFILCTFGYASMAVLGYAMFGQEVQSQITLNLPTNLLSSRIAIYTTLVNPISKYALMVTPIVNAVKLCCPSTGSKPRQNYAIGTALVMSSAIAAIAVPLFADLMTLVGAALSMTASIILPCLCYLKISGAYRRLSLEALFIGSIAALGLVVAVAGTYTSVSGFIGDF